MTIPDSDVPEGEYGDWRVKKMVKEELTVRDKVQAFSTGRTVPPGTYTILYRGMTVVMSDTPDEKRDHREAVMRSRGSCLIAGLGLGMVAVAMAQKKEVDQVVVVEKSEEVIHLVGDHIRNKFPDKITILQSDIFDITPGDPRILKLNPKKRFECIWFDIWDDLCEDNLTEMEKLHRRWGRFADWKGSWGKEYIKGMRRSGW